MTIHNNMIVLAFGNAATYTFLVQAALLGLSSLFPSSKYLMSVKGSTPGYGLRPRLNTSQHVTPNDHWKVEHASKINIFVVVSSGPINCKKLINSEVGLWDKAADQFVMRILVTVAF